MDKGKAKMKNGDKDWDTSCTVHPTALVVCKERRKY